MKSWFNKLFAKDASSQQKDLSQETATHLTSVLQTLIEPLTQQPFANWLVSARWHTRPAPQDSGIALVFEIPFPANSLWEAWKTQIQTHIRTQSDDARMTHPEAPDLPILQIDFVTRIHPRQTQSAIEPIKGVSNVIAVASGKGGVGKSTTAVNLALALASEGAQVAILDADIYGPSMPMLLGLTGERPHTVDGKTMEPLVGHGVKVNSIGFLIEPDSPMIWRGPVLTSSLMQLLNETNWGSIDFLIVDLPPGTGDAQLTLAQKIPVSGAVVVTTPQDLALLDVRKGVKMLEKVNIPILGIVENMSVHICSQCGNVEHIFGQGGCNKMAQDFHIPVLTSLPLDIRIRQQADAGQPILVSDPQGAIASAYRHLAHQVSANLSQRPQSYANKFGKIEVKSTTKSL